MTKTEQILTDKKLRITPMRQLVLDYLLSENRVLGLSELERIFERADRVTIYRTLKVFTDKGILHQINDVSAEVKYGLCQERCDEKQHLDRHPHFHCTICDSIRCLEQVLLPELQLPAGYQIQEQQLTIRGICPNCQA